MLSVWELHTYQYGLRESSAAILHHSIHVYKPSCATGHVGLAGPTCSIPPRNARQRRLQFDSHRERYDGQTCWIEKSGTNQEHRTTRGHVQEDYDDSDQGYARFSQRIEGHDSRRLLVKLQSKGMRILRSMGSRRTSQTCCIEKGRACGCITPS